MSEPKRLFFAIELPGGVREQLIHWRAAQFPPEAGRPIANMLRAQAARSGCYQSPQPFHPHITLLRDAGHAVPIPPPGFGWSFPVTEFALYSSSFARGRTRYTQLQRWTLTE